MTWHIRYLSSLKVGYVPTTGENGCESTLGNETVPGYRLMELGAISEVVAVRHLLAVYG